MSRAEISIFLRSHANDLRAGQTCENIDFLKWHYSAAADLIAADLIADQLTAKVSTAVLYIFTFELTRENLRFS